MLRGNKLIFSNVELFLLSSDLIASQRLLEIAHCIPLSPQSVSSQLISSHFITDFLQILKVQVAKMKPGLSAPRGRSENDPGSNERVPKSSAG